MTPIRWAIVGALFAALITTAGIAYIFKRGSDTGSSSTRAAVSTETVRATDAARQDKEKANETVRRTPLNDLIDNLLR